MMNNIRQYEVPLQRYQAMMDLQVNLADYLELASFIYLLMDGLIWVVFSV